MLICRLAFRCGLVCCGLVRATAFPAQGVQLRLEPVNKIEVPDDDDDDDDDPQQPRANPEPVLNAEVFDQWMFPNQSEKRCLQELDSQLTVRLAELEQACGLSSSQIQKLRIAGQIEMGQLIDRIQAGRRQFERERHDQQNVGQLHQMVQSLQAALTQGLFRNGGLMEKVVRKTLDAGQLARYEQLTQERADYLRRARLEMVLLQLDREVPLRQEQRTRLLALWKQVSTDVPAGPYELQGVWFQLAIIPERNYREILNDRQWSVVQVKLQQARGLEPWLRQNQALPAVAEEP
ncbi:MAG: hypothetical protein U0872_02825 [Planctomycetaceae bacterium]